MRDVLERRNTSWRIFGRHTEKFSSRLKGYLQKGKWSTRYN